LNRTKTIKKYLTSGFNWRIAFAFLAGAIASALLMDFPFFSTPIKDTAFTEGFSNLLATITASIIEVNGYEVTLKEPSILFTKSNGIYFAFGCLGYRQIIWFSVFLLISPGKPINKSWFILLGIIIIEFSNVLRAAIIGISNYHNPQSFEIIHAQGTIWFVYGTVLLLWLFWLESLKSDILSHTTHTA